LEVRNSVITGEAEAPIMKRTSKAGM
jgi:hypothetical protein